VGGLKNAMAPPATIRTEGKDGYQGGKKLHKDGNSTGVRGKKRKRRRWSMDMLEPLIKGNGPRGPTGGDGGEAANAMVVSVGETFVRE